MKSNLIFSLGGSTIVLMIALFSVTSCSKDSVNPVTPTAANFREAGASDAVKSVTAFPNPTTGPLTVRFNEQAAVNYTIQVLDSRKAPLMSTSGVCITGLNDVHVNLTPFGKGNYFIFFQSSDQTQIVPVAVQYP